MFEKLKDLVLMGYRVEFKPQVNQLHIVIEREHRDHVYSKESCLPLSDHFHESRVVDCMTFMETKIEAEIEAGRTGMNENFRHFV